MILVPIKSLQQYFEAENYNLGLKLFKRGGVDPLSGFEETEKSVCFLSGVTSQNRFYRQSIEFTKTEDGSVSIDGACTCIKEYYCEHMAAACFKYFDESKSSPEFQALTWLKQSEKIQLSLMDVEDTANKDESDFIAYRLFPEGFGKDLPDIGFFKSKFLKNGKISKGKEIDFLNLYSLYKSNGIDLGTNTVLTSLDQSIIDLYGKFQGSYIEYNGSKSAKRLRFSGADGFIILKLLSDTNKLFLGDSKDPLKFSDKSFTPNLTWKEPAPGYLKLISDFESRYVLLDTVPEVILDAEQNAFLPLSEHLPKAVLNHLLSAPMVPDDMSYRFLKMINDDFSLYLPPPKNIESIVVDEQLEPSLKVVKHDETSFLQLQLSFNYGDHDVPVIPTLLGRLLFNDQLVDVKRKPGDELKAIEKIEAFGFVKEEQSKSSLYFTEAGTPYSQTNLLNLNKFLSTGVLELKNEGWLVEVDESVGIEFAIPSDITIECIRENDWFSLSFVFEINGEKVSLVPLASEIIKQLESGGALPDELIIELRPGLFLPIPVRDFLPVIKTIIELYDYKQEDDTLLMGAYGAQQLFDIENHVEWKGDQELLDISKKLKEFKHVEDIKPAFAWKLTPRNYQKEAINWLYFLNTFHFGGILADDMGLGKTMTVLSTLSHLKERNLTSKPSLIVLPTSLLKNWQDEVVKFTDNLNFCVLYGPKRQKLFDCINDFDLVFTTYKLMLTDIEKHKALNYEYVILDEAQNIKNHKTALAKAACSINGDHRVAMSGTPVENNLSELWSLFNFVMPGFLGDYKNFKDFFQDPIEKEESQERSDLLNNRIKPFILRRMKSEVLKELPPKTDIVRYIDFSKKEAELYESVRIATEEKISSAVSEKGMSNAQVYLFDALLKLRQACCHPDLLSLPAADLVKESIKLKELLNMLSTLVSEGRKILVFSSFTSMLDIVAKELDSRKFKFEMLTGSSSNRGSIVESFKSSKDIFLISLKAGGVGLNLTEADTVIFYEPWWNPAAEDQAQDRSHRMGQVNPVFAYHLIVKNTIEENILKLQEKKRQLQESVYSGGVIKNSSGLTNDEIMGLLDLKM